jgi:hypothetical protein
MKTFNSCNRVWLTVPEDGKNPLPPATPIRILSTNEKTGAAPYDEMFFVASRAIWGAPDDVGWYPVHADGTDDHETAKRFITEDTFMPRPPRPRQIRRRFKLSTKRSIIKHHP